MASTGVESLPQSAAGAKSQLTEVRVYPHSPILYWWVVWVYGFFCALLTYAQGETFTIGGGKPLLIYPGAWLGISFTLLLLFVALATTVKARGIAAILLILLLIGAAAGTQFIMNIDGLFKTPPAILVHMNLAFYMMVSSSLFVVWFVIIFVADRLSFWRFRGAQIERVQRFASILGRAPESYSVMHVRLTRYSDDLLAHKILGLGIIGLGTSDIEGKIAIFGGGNEQFRIEHVWGAAPQPARDPGDDGTEGHRRHVRRWRFMCHPGQASETSAEPGPRRSSPRAPKRWGTRPMGPGSRFARPG